MKEGWEYKKIGEVFHTYAGGTPSKSNKANYENGTIPWIRSGEVCRKYITESELCISEEGLRNSSAKYYPVDTVLVAMYGATAAQSGILKFKATSNQAVCGVLPNEDFIPEFVYTYFTFIKEELAAQAQGGAQPNISQEKIRKVLFPCIPLSEQRSIVSRLDAAFARIDALKANAERQLAEARALFNSALTEEMTPKEGWEEKTLGEVATVQNGFAFKSNLFKKEGCPIVRISNIQNEEIETEDMVFFDKKDYQVNFDSFMIFPNDILIAMSGGTTGKLGINKTDRIFYQNQRVGVIRENVKQLNHLFLYYYLKTKSEESLRIAAGAAQPNLSTAQIKSFILPVPSLEEQHQIVSRLDALSANVRKLEELQRKTLLECDALKQSLLKEIFT